MRKFIVIAILALLGSTAAAEAKIHQFKFGGRMVRLEVPKNCKKISCIQTNVKEKSSKAAKSESVATAAPAAAAPLAAAAVDSPKAATPVPSAAPAAAAAPAPQATQADDRKPLARLSLPVTEEPKPVVRAIEPAPRTDEPVAAAEPVKPVDPVKSAEPSPIGVWATEKNEGKVRIVECGEVLCGHTEGKPGEKILISMQPGQKNRWNGKIHDVRSGGTYMSHMSMKGANALRVEGCAFGGLFCGGQTWTRVE